MIANEVEVYVLLAALVKLAIVDLAAFLSLIKTVAIPLQVKPELTEIWVRGALGILIPPKSEVTTPAAEVAWLIAFVATFVAMLFATEISDEARLIADVAWLVAIELITLPWLITLEAIEFARDDHSLTKEETTGPVQTPSTQQMLLYSVPGQ